MLQYGASAIALCVATLLRIYRSNSRGRGWDVREAGRVVMVWPSGEPTIEQNRSSQTPVHLSGAQGHGQAPLDQPVGSRVFIGPNYIS